MTSRFLALAAFAVAPLAAQRSVTDRLSGHLPAPVVSAVATIADSALARSLPVDPLVNKAIEGGAKGVPGDRVIAAVSTVFHQMADAATALASGGIKSPDGETVEAGAFALSAGLSAANVAGLAHASGEPRAAPALRVAGALAALGVPTRDAVSLVTETLADGGSADDIGALPARVEANMAHGASPAAAAAAAAHGGVRGSPSTPRRPSRGDHGRKP
ncbi:MAG TPA: hypothetical protein VFK78_02620 [Gemmatimonadales bacterium]|nr:hypothetical protein [Gemmatimonadales bacterium]